MNPVLSPYISQLMENMPSDFINQKCQDIDLIVEGGAFNGAYLIGAYYFLKELEYRKHVKVHRISCCSVSSLCSMAYILDKLELYNEVYKLCSESFRETGTLNIYEKVFDIFRENIDEDAYKKLNGRLYITYNNIQTYKQVTCCKFKSNNHVFETIYRSGFIPYMINKSIAKDGKYIDGFSPYFFKAQIRNRRTMYICLVNWGNIENLTSTMSVKNEVNSIRRVIAGTLDTHNFFMTDIPTQMCCYVDNMPITTMVQIELKKVFTYALMFALSIIVFIIKNAPKNTRKMLIFKVGKAITEETYKVFIQHYCC
jgi:hypothetical protein